MDHLTGSNFQLGTYTGWQKYCESDKATVSELINT
jgi:hypothetical protein